MRKNIYIRTSSIVHNLQLLRLSCSNARWLKLEKTNIAKAVHLLQQKMWIKVDHSYTFIGGKARRFSIIPIHRNLSVSTNAVKVRYNTDQCCGYDQWYLEHGSPVLYPSLVRLASLLMDTVGKCVHLHDC